MPDDPTPDPIPDPAPAPLPPAASGDPKPAEPSEDWKAKYEESLAESRKWETRAKANNAARKELDDLKKQGMTDVEKAAADAHAKGAAEARAQFGARLVDAEVRAAAAGRPAEVIDALLEGLDRDRFLNDDGEPDTKAIGRWVERVAPQPPGPAPLDLGQGARGVPERAPDMNQKIRAAFGRV